MANCWSRTVPNEPDLDAKLAALANARAALAAAAESLETMRTLHQRMEAQLKTEADPRMGGNGSIFSSYGSPISSSIQSGRNERAPSQ